MTTDEKYPNLTFLTAHEMTSNNSCDTQTSFLSHVCSVGYQGMYQSFGDQKRGIPTQLVDFLLLPVEPIFLSNANVEMTFKHDENQPPLKMKIYRGNKSVLKDMTVSMWGSASGVQNECGVIVDTNVGELNAKNILSSGLFTVEAIGNLNHNKTTMAQSGDSGALVFGCDKTTKEYHAIGLVYGAHTKKDSKHKNHDNGKTYKDVTFCTYLDTAQEFMQLEFKVDIEFHVPCYQSLALVQSVEAETEGMFDLLC